ncbi:phage holin family protein [Loktanella sp. S4079]|uniref:phage holin family protein n=1 Tax=Loktanella sp. S4079 TaxID=579483 RepID=UPI0005FA6B86|nr:phage holin family protein [Loktanella sp. S4079]KJZ18558.1 hypothetical protein TW80_14145 [Loktanella sp. S4079]
MFSVIKHNIQTQAKRAALGLSGVVLLTVGIGFLTAAAWMTLAMLADNRIAALILGAAYFGLGLIFLAVSKSTTVGHSHSAPPPPAPQSDPIAGMTAAFVQGLNAGISARHRRAAKHDT